MNLFSDTYLLSNQSFSVMFSKVSHVTVLLYLYSYLFSSPRRRFVLQTEISGKYIQLFVFFNFISVSISSPCRKDQFAVFTFYLEICTDPDLR